MVRSVIFSRMRWELAVAMMGAGLLLCFPWVSSRAAPVVAVSGEPQSAQSGRDLIVNDKDPRLPARQVLVAQASPAGGTPPPSPESDVRISVSISKAFGQLPYRAQNKADTVSIIPDNKRLMEGWKSGGSISFLGNYVPSQSSDVGLRIRVRNAGSKPIELRGGSLDVEKSREDLQPLLASHYNADDQCISAPLKRTEIDFFNYGLSDPQAASLVIGFSKGGEGANAGTQALYAKHEVASIGFKEFAARYDLRASLDQAGFATQKFVAWSDIIRAEIERGESASSRQILPCGSISDAACLEKLRADGLLGKLAPALRLEDGALKTTLVGELKHEWKDADGVLRRYSAPFSHQLVLGCRKRNPSNPAIGWPAPPPPDQDAASWILLQLGTRGDRYKQAFPTSAVIPAGGVRDFRLQLRTPKSSEHVFRAVFRSTDGTLYKTQPIKLQTFIPR